MPNAKAAKNRDKVRELASRWQQALSDSEREVDEREAEFEAAREERKRALQLEHEERARAHMRSLQAGAAVGEPTLQTSAANALDAATAGTPRIGTSPSRTHKKKHSGMASSCMEITRM